MITKSELRIASRARGLRRPPPIKKASRMGTLASCRGTSISLSPTMRSPFSSVTPRCTLSSVTGITLPRTSNIVQSSSMPRSKSPMMSESAVNSRLPTVWPAMRLPSLKRYSKRRRTTSVSSASATIARRTSPGGRMPNSSRSSPVEPPESAAVTIAARFRSLFRLSPERTLKVPVPPPMVVMLVLPVCMRNPVHP